MSSQLSLTTVDDHAFLLASDPAASGCDLIGGSPSYSSPFPTSNDGTGHSPVHLERPTFESQSARWVAALTHVRPLPQAYTGAYPAVMGTIPELDGNIFPSSPGWMPERRFTNKTSGSGGKASRRPRPDSRAGWDHLPEHFGSGAHDGGIFPSLGFSS